MLEEKTKEAERTAELAEADAREKDKELVETLKRLKDYESVCIFISSVKEFRLFLPLTGRLFCAIYCVPSKTFQKCFMIKVILVGLYCPIQTFEQHLLFSRRIVF